MALNKRLEAGQKFNRLTVIKLDHIEDKTYNCKRTKSGKRTLHLEYYLCKCECGNETIVEKSHLRKKVDATESCGCMLGTHHMSKNNRIYDIWTGIRSRCFGKNKSNPDYKNYNGRGITLCDEWKNDFMNFYNWAIANGYRNDLTIDRIDVNGNYEPSNCRWANKKEQNNNKRNNLFVKYNGKEYSITKLAEMFGRKYHTVYMQYRRNGFVK